MKLKIVTPCGRPAWLLPAYFSLSRACFLAKIQLDWTILVTPEERKSFPEHWLLDCVKLVTIEPGVGNTHYHCQVGISLFNQFVPTLDPEEWVWFFSDDSVLPAMCIYEIVSALALAPGKEVIIVSIKRGQRQECHLADPLIADPSNMQLCRIAGEQALYKAKHFTGYALNEANGDGQFLVSLWNRASEKFLFLPNTYTAFNAQKASRWDLQEAKNLLQGIV